MSFNFAIRRRACHEKTSLADVVFSEFYVLAKLGDQKEGGEKENEQTSVRMVQNFLHNCTIANYKQENVGTYFL